MRRCLALVAMWASLALLHGGALGQQAGAGGGGATAPGAGAVAAESGLVAKLRAIPGVVDVRPMGTGRGGRGAAGGAGAAVTGERYQVMIEQPLDHTQPGGDKFRQKFFISHVGYDRPVLLGTEGYSSGGLSGGELQRMLGGNQVTVEHRFFGDSIPQGGNAGKWRNLTVKNAADDMHKIVSGIRTFYTGKWVSTGSSKGGQTALFHKCYYPEDVDAVVAYVAPINIGQEDPRINMFINSVGDEATRKRIKEFQIALFKREPEILPLVRAQADQRGWTFSMGFEKAYEYGVLEYPYAFWQYGTNPNSIPAPDAPAATLAGHYNQVGMLQYYADQGKRRFEAFLYQAMTEIGYYNYDITDFKEFMTANKNPTNLDICPDDVRDQIVYNPAAMAFVFNTLQYKANNVVYIYGELDSWSSTQIQLLGRTNAIKIVVKGGHHGSRIANASPQQQEQFYSAMESWLGMKLTR